MPPACGFQNLRALTFIIALGFQNVLRFLGGTLFRDSHATRLIGPVGEIAFLLRCHPLSPAKMCVLPKRLSREGGSSHFVRCPASSKNLPGTTEIGRAEGREQGWQ